MRKVTKKWKMKDGTKIRICDMMDSHLANAIKMLERMTRRREGEMSTLGYQMLGVLQGEMAIDSVERDLDVLEEYGLDPADEFPLYLDLCSEVTRRELKELKEKK